VDWQETLADLTGKLEGWVEAAVLKLPNLFVAVLIFVVAWIGAKLVRRLLGRALDRTGAPQQIRNLLVTVVGVAVVAAGLFIALGVLELDKTVASLLAGAGILGLALGFAFQDIAANFIAGIYFALRRPFRTGDVVETNDFFGTVERVDLRSLVLRRPAGQLVMIPNKSVFENPLVNYSTLRARRVDLAVGASYGDDLERVREVAIRAVEGVEGRDPERRVELFYEAFGDSSIDFLVRFWVPYRKQSDYLAARSEAIVRIHRAFDEAGLTIPFPIRTLDFGIVGGETLAEALPEPLGGGRGTAD